MVSYRSSEQLVTYQMFLYNTYTTGIINIDIQIKSVYISCFFLTVCAETKTRLWLLPVWQLPSVCVQGRARLVSTCLVSHWYLTQLVSSTVPQWLEEQSVGLSLGSNPVLPCQTLGKFVHSRLLQFTLLYECVPGYRQWWVFVHEKNLWISWKLSMFCILYRDKPLWCTDWKQEKPVTCPCCFTHKNNYVLVACTVVFTLFEPRLIAVHWVLWSSQLRINLSVVVTTMLYRLKDET